MSELRYIGATALRPVLSASSLEEARTLAAYLDDNPDIDIAVASVPFADLLRTYSRRLRRYHRSEGPVCNGLERFVETLRSEGSVEMFAIQSEATGWIGLLQDDGSLLDVTSVDRG